MDFREVENFLRSRRSDGRCPFCKHNNWLPIEADGALRLPAGAGTVDATGFGCGNCGYLRLHANNIILGDTKRPAAETE